MFNSAPRRGKPRFVYVFAGLIAGCFLLSLFLFLFMENNLEPRVMLFPGVNLSKQTGEIRYVPRQATMEERIEKYIQELILGPSRLDLSRLFPEHTKLQSVILRDSTLYVDFSEDLLFQGRDDPLPFDETIELFRRSLILNFRWIKKMYITINGRLPDNWNETEGNKKKKSR